MTRCCTISIRVCCHTSAPLSWRGELIAESIVLLLIVGGFGLAGRLPSFHESQNAFSDARGVCSELREWIVRRVWPLRVIVFDHALEPPSPLAHCIVDILPVEEKASAGRWREKYGGFRRQGPPAQKALDGTELRLEM